MDKKSPLDYCHGIVSDVSRTFALSIGGVEDLLSDYTCIGYLLCRIPDTIEDLSEIPNKKKIELLKTYLKMLETEKGRYELIDKFVNTSERYNIMGAEGQLIKNTGKVFRAFEDFYGEVKQSMQSHISTMVNGMNKTIQNSNEGVRIRNMDEFSEYCYYVAGTVGGLLTDIFQTTGNLSQRTTRKLKKYSDGFGEALQTVNIIKDIYTDYEDENNIYIPQKLLREEGTSQERMFKDKKKSLRVIRKIREHARNNLKKAQEYIKILPTKSIGARKFTIIPYLLAVSTLRETEKHEEDLLGPEPVKIGRSEVFEILNRLPKCVEDNNYLEKIAKKGSKAAITPDLEI